MLIEQSAYANRWRSVSPAAKGLFALAGFVAAFAAGRPVVALAVAAALVAAALLGAGVAPGRYLRVAAPALVFLALGGLSIAFTLGLEPGTGSLSLQLLPDGLTRLTQVTARSVAALASLLFLVLTTPLIDLIALLRRLGVPETLLELMVLCYRMLFVFSEAMHDTWTAQSARLGYARPRLALRSLGALVANLTVQIWQRASDLHIAAQARNNDGPLRFLESEFVGAKGQLTTAACAGSALIALAWLAS